jgi:hypothetical protein
MNIMERNLRQVLIIKKTKVSKRRCINHVDYDVMTQVNQHVHSHIDQHIERGNYVYAREANTTNLRKSAKLDNLRITETEPIVIPVVFYVKCPNQANHDPSLDNLTTTTKKICYRSRYRRVH